MPLPSVSQTNQLLPNQNANITTLIGSWYGQYTVSMGTCYMYESINDSLN